MSKIRNNLSRKLSLGILLLIVPVFIVSLGVFYLQSSFLIRKEAVKRANSALQVVRQHMDNFMNSIEVSTDANAWLLEENFRPDSIETITQRILRQNRNIISCSVCAEPGKFPQYGQLFSVYTANDDSIVSVRETDFDYTVKSWYKIAHDSGSASWVEPFSEYAGWTINPNEAVASYCRPLRSKEGDIIGVISTDFAFSRLAKNIIDAEHPYPSAYFLLIGADGRYFYHPDTTRLFRNTLFTETDPRQDADIIALGYEMTAGKQGTMHVDVEGKEYHVCYAPVAGTKWSLAMVCPEDEILIGYDRLGYVIVILILLGLVVVWWLCQRGVRRAIEPINKLLGYTQHIAEGNYSETIPQSSEQDDIGRLQNSFAAMQKALRENMGSIRETAEEVRKQNERRANEMKLAEEAVKKKTSFIQNLSHQIRTPLSIIMGFANVLSENVSSCSKRNDGHGKIHGKYLYDIVSMMKYNAIHLKRMVVMLLDCSSAEGPNELMSNRHDEVSCNEVARESIAYTEEHFPGLVIKLESQLPDEVCILTNHLYMTRIIRELLYNSAKYSDGEHVALFVSETSTTIRFIVEDVGPGLPDNCEELVNKPFVKLDDLSEGFGIGLPLTKRHALTLGGDLIYDSSYRDGCRFIVEMPK